MATLAAMEENPETACSPSHPPTHQERRCLGWRTPAKPPHVPRLHELRVVGIGRRASPICDNPAGTRGAERHAQNQSQHGGTSQAEGREGGHVSRAASASNRPDTVAPSERGSGGSQTATGHRRLYGIQWDPQGGTPQPPENKKSGRKRRTAGHHDGGGPRGVKMVKRPLKDRRVPAPARQPTAVALHRDTAAGADDEHHQ